MTGGFSEVSGESYGIRIAGENLGLVSGGRRVGERPGLGVSWRSQASAGGVGVWVGRALMGSLGVSGRQLECHQGVSGQGNGQEAAVH